jgi:hypothetical protein
MLKPKHPLHSLHLFKRQVMLPTMVPTLHAPQQHQAVLRLQPPPSLQLAAATGAYMQRLQAMADGRPAHLLSPTQDTTQGHVAGTAGAGSGSSTAQQGQYTGASACQHMRVKADTQRIDGPPTCRTYADPGNQC